MFLKNNLVKKSLKKPEQSFQDNVVEDDNSLEEMEVDEGDGDGNIFDIISYAMSIGN